MNKFNSLNQYPLQPVKSLYSQDNIQPIQSQSKRLISVSLDSTQSQITKLVNLSDLNLIKGCNYIINLQLSFVSNSTNIKYLQFGISNKANCKLYFETENNISFEKLTKNINVLLTADDDEYYIFSNSTSLVGLDFSNSYCNILQL